MSAHQGSMSGPKIRSAIENVQAILANRINDNDHVAVTVFSQTVHTVIPLIMKGDSKSSISSQIAAFTSPSGGTGDNLIFDCCNLCMYVCVCMLVLFLVAKNISIYKFIFS